MVSAIGVGLVLAILSAYQIHISLSGRKVTYEPRTHTEYETTLKLLLDAPGFGLGRIGMEESGFGPWVWDRTINVTNTYSHLLTSDIVMSRLKQRAGTIKGSVAAVPIPDTPLIQVTVVGDDPQEIQKLAQTTADTFIDYITVQQEENKVSQQDRILVKIMTSASPPIPLSSRRAELAFLAFIAPLLAAIAASLALENLTREKTRPDRKHSKRSPGEIRSVQSKE